MSTGKTLLIVGGVAVGVYALVRLTAGPAKVAPRSVSGTSLITANNIVGLGSFIGGLFKGGSSSGSVPADQSLSVYKPGESLDTYTTSIFGPGINSDGTGADSSSTDG